MNAVYNDFQERCVKWSDIADHLPRLHAEACRDNVKVIELGVRSGNSTAAFLAAAEAYDGHVWSVDIEGAVFPNHWYTDRWEFIVGDDMDEHIQARLPGDVDVLFIDTSHHFEHTYNELVAYVSKVKPGGVVLMHDTELDTPMGAAETDPKFPVALAITRYAGEHGLTVEWVPGCYGLGVIHIGGAS